MEMQMHTWWILAGLALVGFEMLTGTFYLLALSAGMAFGALTAALEFSVTAQTAVAALSSVALVILLHAYKAKQLAASPASDASSLDAGAQVQVQHWLSANTARVRYRGSDWDARLGDGLGRSSDDLYVIVEIQNACLVLKPHQPTEPLDIKGEFPAA